MSYTLITKGDQKSSSNGPQKLAVKGLKFSDRGFTFNERVIYIDQNEIKYYSKILSNNPASKRLLEE